VRQWTDQTEGNRDVVLTGKQRAHYLARHPDTAQLEGFIPDAVLGPDEVHRNRYDPAMAIFYKIIDSTRYVRVAVLMQLSPGELKHSVLSYRLARQREVEHNLERIVWKAT